MLVITWFAGMYLSFQFRQSFRTRQLDYFNISTVAIYRNSTNLSQPYVTAFSTSFEVSTLVKEFLRSIARLSELRTAVGSSESSSEGLEESFPDLPPLAHARTDPGSLAISKPEPNSREQLSSDGLQGQNMDNTIDFGEPTGIRTRGKAKKAAAKKAQKDKWASEDGDGENKGEGADGGDGGDGGGGDGGDAGGGGAGGGGDGGDDWDDGGWDTGKKKKDKKKAKEEERKAKEEEERKKKEEEEQAKKDEEIAANALSWADETNDANANDEWAFSSSKKDKDKKKKNKKVGWY